MSKVSVIIATYNHAHYVSEAVDSVLAQTYRDIEIIVIDDGSTDNTKEILTPYIKENKICYIYQENRGRSVARNQGVRTAKGQYVKFLDSDDFLYPKQIELQVDQLGGTDDVLSITDSCALRPNGEIIRRKLSVAKDDRQLAELIRANLTVIHAFLIPKIRFEEIGGFDEALTACEDWDLWIRMRRTGAVIKHLPIVGCCYRILYSSTSADVVNEYLYKCKVIEKANKWLFNEDNFSPYLIECVLMINVRLIEEGIARKISLQRILKNTLTMTDVLFRSQKKGILKILLQVIGGKNYCQLRYIFRTHKDKNYEFRILNETNLRRYGDKYVKNSSSNKFLKAMDQLNKRGIILMYHRVARLDHDPWLINVTPEHFEEHMRVIKKYGRPVQMRKMKKNTSRFLFGRKEIVITFDDGYSDNFYNAKPILERYQIPATFFVVSGAVNSLEEFWWDELERIILLTKILPVTFDLTIAGKEYQWMITPGGPNLPVTEIPANGEMISQAELYVILWRILSGLDFSKKKIALKQIASWAGAHTTPRSDYLPMTTKELLSLNSSSLFEIGAHTVIHPMLSRLSSEEQEQEIGCSKRDLEKIINQEVTTFSYPHGDHSDITVELVKKFGFHYACTVQWALVMRNSDAFRLPRFKVLNWSGDEFERNLTNWLKG